MNRKNNFLSIIIPVHNRAAEVKKLLESIEKNNISINFEIICVLDNCIDDSENICRKYNAKCFNNNIKSGAGYSRHLGALKSSGDILLFLDSDTILDDFIINEMLIEFKSENSNAAICGDYKKEILNDSYLTRFLGLKWYYTVTELVLKNKKRDIIIAFGGGPCMISSDIYFKTGGYDFKNVHYKTCGGEEFEIALKISNFANIYFYERFNVYHRYRTGFQAFALTIKRTYNYAMILLTAGEQQKNAMKNLVCQSDKVKLILNFLVWCFLFLFIILKLNIFLTISFLSFFASFLIDLRFMNFIRKEAGIFYLPVAFLQEFILTLSKGIGVSIAFINFFLFKKNNFRF